VHEPVTADNTIPRETIIERANQFGCKKQPRAIPHKTRIPEVNLTWRSIDQADLLFLQDLDAVQQPSLLDGDADFELLLFDSMIIALTC
jgi:hypothetical protein